MLNFPVSCKVNLCSFIYLFFLCLCVCVRVFMPGDNQGVLVCICRPTYHILEHILLKLGAAVLQKLVKPSVLFSGFNRGEAI